MKYILTVTLNPALDKTVPLTNFVSPKGYKAKKEVVSAGGKGINVSRTLNLLGSPTLAMGILGGRSGRMINRLLKKEKIKSDFVDIKEESRTNLTLKDAPTKNRMRVMGKGPVVDNVTLKSFERRYVRLLKGSAMVSLCGRNVQGAPKDYYGYLIRLAKKEKIRTVLDTSAEAFIEGLKSKPFMIKPNLKEAQEVLKEKLTSLALLKRALKRFQGMGVKIVIVTLGRRGALGMYKDQIWYCRPRRVKINHDVGCGDAFLAGFIHAFLNKQSFVESLCFATSCGTASCQEAIPGQINKRAVFRHLAAIKVKAL